MANESIIDCPTPVDNQDLHFKLVKRTETYTYAGQPPPTFANVIAVANALGVTFVGTFDGLLVVLTSSLASDKFVHKEIHLQARPTHLAVNCDETLLAVGFSPISSALTYVYDIASLHNQGTLPLIRELRLSTSPSVGICDLVWNPTCPPLLSACLSDGSIQVVELKPNAVELNSLPPTAGARCLCWSPKGKQIVVGGEDGKLIQYKPDMSPAKALPAPSLFGGNAAVISVLWISNFQFAAYYRDRSKPDELPVLVIANAPKKEPVTFVNYDDITYGSYNFRCPQIYFLHLAAWNLILVCSANSIEVAVLHSSDGKTWEQWQVGDSSRAELPLTSLQEETYPLGMALDLSSQAPVPWPIGETVLPPMPRLLLMSHEGKLCIFDVVFLQQGAPVISSAPSRTVPETFFDSVGVKEQKTQNSSSAAQPQPFSAFKPSTPQTQPVPIKTSTPFVAPQPELLKVPVPSMFVPPQPVSAPSVLVAPQPPPVTAPEPLPAKAPTPVSFLPPQSVSVKPLQPATNVTPHPAPLKLLNPPAYNQPPQSAVKIIPTQQFSVSSPSQAPTSLVKPMFDKKPEIKTSELANDSKVPPPLTAVQESAEDNPDDAAVYEAAIMDEVCAIDNELRMCLKETAVGSLNLGSEEQFRGVVQRLTVLEDFEREVEETTVSQAEEVSELKMEVLELLAKTEDARLVVSRRNSKLGMQLRRDEQLDPVAARTLRDVLSHRTYIETQLLQIADHLERQWEEYQQACRQEARDRMETPLMEDICKTLDYQRKLLCRQKIELARLQKEIESVRGPTTARPPNRIRHDVSSPRSAELSKLAESLLGMNIRDGLSMGNNDLESESPRQPALPNWSVESLTRLLDRFEDAEVPVVTRAMSYPEREAQKQEVQARLKAAQKKIKEKKKAEIEEREVKAEKAAAEKLKEKKKAEMKEREVKVEKATAIESQVCTMFNQATPPDFGGKTPVVPQLSSTVGGAKAEADKTYSLNSAKSLVDAVAPVEQRIASKKPNEPSGAMLGPRTVSSSHEPGVSSAYTPAMAPTSSIFGTPTTKPVLSGTSSPAVSFGKSGSGFTGFTAPDATLNAPVFNFGSSFGQAFGAAVPKSSGFLFGNADSTTSVDNSAQNVAKTEGSFMSFVTKSPSQTTFSFSAPALAPTVAATKTLTAVSTAGAAMPHSVGLSSTADSGQLAATSSNKIVTISKATSSSQSQSGGKDDQISNVSSPSTTVGTSTALPLGGSIFGLPPSSGIFGSATSSAPTSFLGSTASGGSIFGTPATTSPSVFSLAAASSSMPSGSIFGSSGSVGIFGSLKTTAPIASTTNSVVISASSSNDVPKAATAVSSTNSAATISTTTTSLPEVSSFGIASSGFFVTQSGSTPTASGGIFSAAAVDKTISSSNGSATVTSITSMPSVATTPSTVAVLSTPAPVTTTTTTAVSFGNPVAAVTSSGGVLNAPITGASSPPDALAVTTTQSLVQPVAPVATLPTVRSESFTATGTLGVGLSSAITASTSSSSQSNTAIAPTSSDAGQPGIPVATSSNAGLFGTPSTPSAFGAATTSPFGGQASTASVFGGGSGSIFGTPVTSSAANVFGSPVSPPGGASVFSTPVSQTGNIFGSSPFAQPAGATSSTSVFGTPTSPKTGTGFGADLTQTTNLFGSMLGAGSPQSASQSGNIFSQVTPTKSAFDTGGSIFGASNSPFGSPGGNVFAQASSNIFGAATTSSNIFGQSPATTTSSFFGQAVCSPFGSGSAAPNQSPFGNPTATTKSPFESSTFVSKPVFGQSVFGQAGNTSSIFATGTSGGSLFGGNSSSGAFQSGGSFSSPSGPFSGGSGSVSQSGFGGGSSFSKPAGGFGGGPIFGSTPSAAFGSTPSFGGAPAFGSPSAFGSPQKTFGSPTPTANPAFGQASGVAGFESLATQNTVGFGNLAQMSGGQTFGAGFAAAPNAFGAPTSQQQPQQSTSFGGNSFSSWR